MPDTNDGPEGRATVTVETPSASGPMPGFSEAYEAAIPLAPQGEPAPDTAVEKVETSEAPEAPAEKPADEKPQEPAKVEEKPAAATPPNFDGLSKEQRETWERLFKAGAVSADEVERARIESLFQRSWTKNHDKLKSEREAFEKEREGWKEDYALLQRIRGSDHLHSVWLKMSKGEYPTEESDGADLIDAKKAEEIADRRYEAREKAKAAQSTKESATFEAKRAAIGEVVSDAMKAYGLTTEQADAYLSEEAEEFPDGVDPLRYLIENVSPTTVRKNIDLRHKAAKAAKEAADLREQLNQRTSKDLRASKASLPPARRVADTVEKSTLQRTLDDLGLRSLSEVQGFGNRDGG